MPTVLVLGGVGFIGRNLVQYIIDNNLASYIRVADKVLPATAYLSETHKKSFEDPRVEFKQANLVDAAFVERVFTHTSKFDIVVNCAAETKYGQSEEVYADKVFNLSCVVAREAAKRNVAVFVELSTAQVYEADKKPSNEDSKQKPWTMIAKFKAKAEAELRTILKDKLIVLRPATVYGPADIYGITPRLIVGAVYKELKEEMKLLWSKDLKLNTVHVADVARAIWWVAATKEEGGGRSGPLVGPLIFNLADKSDTDQGSINEFIRQIYGIDTGFHGTILSQFARLNLESVTDEVNDKHLQPWAELCKKGKIANTPLTPYLDKELLKDNSLSIDGSKIERDLGFVYSVPEVTLAHLRAVVDDFVSTGIWPNGTTTQ